VTEADHAADAFVKRRLGEVFPEAAWLSEETANGAARLDRVLAPALDETAARGTGAELDGKSLRSARRIEGTRSRIAGPKPLLDTMGARWRVSPVSTLRRP
jgi:myo-inositol-1(or 4)-monophosphatase